MLTVCVSSVAEMRSRQCIVSYNHCTLHVKHTFVDDGPLNADTEYVVDITFFFRF